MLLLLRTLAAYVARLLLQQTHRDVLLLLWMFWEGSPERSLLLDMLLQVLLPSIPQRSLLLSKSTGSHPLLVPMLLQRRRYKKSSLH